MDPSGPQSSKVIAGGLTLDTSQKRAWYGKVSVELSPSQYRVLLALAVRVNTVVPREELLLHLYGDTNDAHDFTVESHIKSIRKKLHTAGAPRELIYTVSRVGYVLRPKVIV